MQKMKKKNEIIKKQGATKSGEIDSKLTFSIFDWIYRDLLKFKTTKNQFESSTKANRDETKVISQFLNTSFILLIN